MNTKDQVHAYVKKSCEEFLARHNLGQDCRQAAECGTYVALIDMCMRAMTDEQIRACMPHVFKEAA